MQKNIDYTEWLAGEEEFAAHKEIEALNKRIAFLTEEVYVTKRELIKAHNALEFISVRQDVQTKTIEKLGNTLQSLSKLMGSMD